MTPTEVQLRAGESMTITAEGLTCGGKKTLAVDMRWTSDDLLVATVDETSGRTTGIGAGATQIHGRDVGRYGIGPVVVPVTVMP